MPAFPLPFFGFSTKRLMLRELRLSDVSAISRIRSDESVNKYLERPREHGLEKAEAFILKIQSGIKAGSNLYWALCLKPEDDLIGTICLWNFSEEEQSAELGFELLPEYQGRGLMQEAVEAILAHGFRTLQLDKVIACTHPQNAPSLRLLEKTGFIPSSSPASNLKESFFSFERAAYSRLHPV
jgi:ribosomal-protein-alanine N-acetyltransferase